VHLQLTPVRSDAERPKHESFLIAWDGHWSDQQQLHPEYVATDLTLVPKADGSLALVITGARGAPGKGNRVETMYSELR
jgi:hypothetical protein